MIFIRKQMDKEQGYIPEDGFEVDSRESVVDFDLTDSTELWLLQFPNNQLPDFKDKELLIQLNQEGYLGSFESSGKVYEMVNSTVQEPSETVFASSGSQSKILGKISRRVSLVHFPQPKELEVQEAEKKKKSSQSSRYSIMNSSHHSTPTSKQRGSSLSKGRASTRSSRPKSSLSEAGEPTTSSRKKPRKDESVW